MKECVYLNELSLEAAGRRAIMHHDLSYPFFSCIAVEVLFLKPLM